MHLAMGLVRSAFARSAPARRIVCVCSIPTICESWQQLVRCLFLCGQDGTSDATNKPDRFQSDAMLTTEHPPPPPFHLLLSNEIKTPPNDLGAQIMWFLILGKQRFGDLVLVVGKAAEGPTFDFKVKLTLNSGQDPTIYCSGKREHMFWAVLSIF